MKLCQLCVFPQKFYTPDLWHIPHVFRPGGFDVWTRQELSTHLSSLPPGRTCLYGTEQHIIPKSEVLLLNHAGQHIKIAVAVSTGREANSLEDLKCLFVVANAFLQCDELCALCTASVHVQTMWYKPNI